VIVHRSILAFALVAFALLVSPALASQQTFAFPVGGHLYSPTQITLVPSDTLCWSPQASSFSEHPLVFDTGDVSDHGSGSTDYCPAVGTLRPGFYAFHCSIHGHAGAEGTVGSGMAGSFTIPGDTTAVPDFSITQDGAGVTFTYTGGPDPDSGDSIAKYAWDFDGNGSRDTTTTETTVQHTYTANGTFHPTLWVIDTGHVLSDAVTHDLVVTGIPDPAPAPGPAPPPGSGDGGSTGIGPVADVTPPTVHLTLAKTLTVRSTLRLAFTTDEPATAIATLKVGRRTAKAGHAFATAGGHTLTVKLSRALRRALRHRRTATLTLVVTDASGNRTTLKRTVRLKSR